MHFNENYIDKYKINDCNSTNWKEASNFIERITSVIQEYWEGGGGIHLNVITA